jgi:RimJ/RimL family protein N-acetyltransferase
LKAKKSLFFQSRPEHRELLRKSATDDRVWKLSTYISKYSPDLFNTWFTMTFNNSLSGSEVCFSIAHASELIGSSRYYLINEVKKEISIGFTWIHPDHWDSSVNPEMKYLMLKMLSTMVLKKSTFTLIISISTRKLPSKNSGGF